MGALSARFWPGIPTVPQSKERMDRSRRERGIEMGDEERWEAEREGESDPLLPWHHDWSTWDGSHTHTHTRWGLCGDRGELPRSNTLCLARGTHGWPHAHTCRRVTHADTCTHVARDSHGDVWVWAIIKVFSSQKLDSTCLVRLFPHSIVLPKDLMFQKLSLAFTGSPLHICSAA